MHEGVREALSNDRLASYLRGSDNDLDRALHLYRWNQEVAGALLRPLCDLEITLRNALTRQLERISHPDSWWEMPALLVDKRCRLKVNNAAMSLLKAGKARTSGAMVAEMSFGFWVALVDRGFDMSLWRRGLHRAFPRYRGPRKLLHTELQRMLGLRNRISHHEPIHHRHLAADRETVHRLLGYLSPDRQQWSRRGDRFPEALACRPLSYPLVGAS